jgi:2,3-dihydroxyphenylpropionate 1,2-dioxygenase
VLPIVVIWVAVTRPPFKRIREFGAAAGRYLGGLDRRIAGIGSGGLSHDPPTPRLDMRKPEVVARLVDRHVATRLRRTRSQDPSRRGGGHAGGLALRDDARILPHHSRVDHRQAVVRGAPAA